MNEQTAEFMSLIQSNLTSPMMALWTKVAEFTPNLIAALVMLAFGWLIAKTVSVVIATALSKLGIDRLGALSGIQEILANTKLKRQEPSAILGRIGFWLVMLTFIMSAAEALGLPQVSATMDKFVLYLPKVLAAAVVLLVGLFIAQFVRTTITTAASGIRAENASVVSGLVYWFLVVVVSTQAIAQLDINVELLNQVIAIALISVGAGFALALGLGGKDIAKERLEALSKQSQGTSTKDTKK